MFNKHPKGLIAASFANLGERFGVYTMMAILVLFLQAKFGLDGKEAGLIYSTFYFSFRQIPYFLWFLLYWDCLDGGRLLDACHPVSYSGCQ